MKTVCCIQARLASRRFPRKALADLLGHPLIWWVCTRVREVKDIDAVRLVCPIEDAEAFTALALPCEVIPAQTVPVRWHPDGTVAAWDVLGAFASVASDLVPTDKAIRITGDCPAVSPEAIALTLRELEINRQDDYWGFATSEHEASGWPDGTGCEAFWVECLRWAAERATWPRDREHVTRWMARNDVPLVVENPHGDFGHLKLSVDVAADLTAVREYLQAESGAHPG